MKRTAALFLALVFALNLTLPLSASAEEERVEIASLSDFLAFAAACEEEGYSKGRTFVLTADIDLSRSGFAPIPYFAGIFEGGDHSVMGLEITAPGSRMGLFRRTGQEARIASLHVSGRVCPGGTGMQVGGIVGENAGSLVSCSFEGTVQGIEDVGGIVGRNTEAGRVSGCRFTGELTGEHQAGGVAGFNAGALSGCENRGEVNTAAITPAGEKRFDLSAIQQDDFVNLANIGGVAGENTGVLLNCANFGPVGYKYNAYNVGGVAGKSSGFLRGCTNSGPVTGRRDVGGIAGQLIPYALWDFSDGRLDGLAGAIGGLQVMLAEMAQDARGLSGEIAGELANMNAYTADALYALNSILYEMEGNDLRILDSIVVDPETGELYFAGADLSFADNTALAEALGNMQAEASVLAQLAGASTVVVADDLSRVADQMSAVFSALYAAVSSAGGGIAETTDLSDAEAWDHDTGAIDACVNTGSVDAENHAGGVVGTVAFEVEFDMEDRLDASQFLFSSARQYLFACVRDSGSYGAVCAKEEGAGGVAGTVDLGALVDCLGLGEVRSTNGDYVGGIVGRSRGTVRACWARAVLSGKKYVGGIAGLGTDLYTNRSWPHVESSDEYRGAVAGWCEGTAADNLYVPTAPAGVDGVSLLGQCAKISSEALLALEGVPADFDRVTLRFAAGGKLIETRELPFGGSVDALPEVPNRDGWYWKWDDFDQDHIYYSRTVSGKYYSPSMTLSTGEDVPLFLVEGVFYEGQKLTVAEKRVDLPAEELYGAWTLRVNDYEGELTVRLYAPEEGSVSRVGENGGLTRLSAARDGSYLVFKLANGGSVAYTHSAQALPRAVPVAAVAGGSAVLLGMLILLIRKKRKKTGQPAEAESEAAAAKE